MLMALYEHQVFAEDARSDAQEGETVASDDVAFEAAVEAIDAHQRPEEIIRVFRETAARAGEAESVQAEEFAAIEAALQELLGDDYTPQRLDDLLVAAADEEGAE